LTKAAVCVHFGFHRFELERCRKLCLLILGSHQEQGVESGWSVPNMEEYLFSVVIFEIKLQRHKVSI
jgi:hypothetical protein